MMRIDSSRPKWIRLLLPLLIVLAASGRPAAAEPSQAPAAGPPRPEIQASAAGDRLEVTYRIPAGYHMIRQERFLRFTVETAGYRIGPIAYPAGSRDAAGDERYTGELVLSAPLSRLVPAAAASSPLIVAAAWQMCDESGTCLMPASATVAVALGPSSGGAALAGSGGAPALGPPRESLWLMLVFALLGGLILNLMPCVLPVLSLKALSLVKSARSDRREVLKGALAYTAGVLVCFAVLALVVIAVKSAGRDVGWGFQFQDWRFVLALALVIWIFALSLFEVFIITPPGLTALDEAAGRGGHWGSFLSGTFSVLLATPCTAPLLGSAMGYAFSQPPALILLFFLTVGLGLALPFLLLGFFPAALRLIPRPGDWMIAFRELMAFLLVGTVVYLLDILRYQIGEGIIAVIWYLLLAAVAAWLYGKFANPTRPAGQRRLFTLAALILLAGPLPWVLALGNAAQERLMASGRGGTDSDEQPGVLRFSPERIEREIRSGRSVFIDFGAAWCATCRYNEGAVLASEAVRAAFKAHGVLVFRADYTNPDPVIAEWLTRYERAGVPLYLLFRPGTAAPHVFPELLTREMVLQELEAPGTGSGGGAAAPPAGRE